MGSNSDWLPGDVITNGIKIHYYRTGGDKPPLVLAHGFSDNGLCWTRVARVLAESYDLIMADARGHGLSDAPEGGYTSQEHAADLAGLIEAPGLDRPALMGHPMGASTVAATAVGYPELVACAVLEAPPWFAEDSPRFRERAGLTPEERQAQVAKMREEILQRRSRTHEAIVASGRKNSPTWDEIEFGPWADSKLQLSPNVVDGRSAPRAPWTEVASKILCPTLLITGDTEANAIVTAEIAEQAAALNPNIHVIHIEGAGHNIRRERFEPFVQAVTKFLAEAYR